MERIGQADIITILEKLHVELKAQTRESKADQHRLLRKSFHYVTATLHKPLSTSQRSSAQGRKLSEVTHRVLQELFALLVGGDGFAPPRIRVLAAALVRELSAGETPYFFRDNFGGNFSQYDQNKVKYFMPVLSELSNSHLLIQNISNLVGWFIGDNDQHGLKTVALSNLIALVQRFPNVLDKDKHIRPMEAKFRQILTGASLETRKTTSTTLFGVRIVSTSSACNVTEVDGTPTRDFFTCMSNSYDYSEDQILNVHVFSSLYYWVFHLYQAQFLEARKKQSREDIVSKLEHFGLTTHDTDRPEASAHQGPATPSPQSEESVRMSPIGLFTLDETFREVVISICLRILSQVERDIVAENITQMRLGSKYAISDLDWMKEFTEATSMEAVRLLDLLCLMDPSLVSCIFPAVKKVYERTVNRQSGLVFSAVLQFFVNHGQHVIFNVDPVLHHFFVDYVSVRYRQQLLAMSTLLFLTTNTSKMLLHTPVFPKYYPAIIKLLAWHPRTVASEVLPLVPAMVGPTTFMELFHTLLDLPLTAAFMEQYDRPEESAETQWSRLGLDRLSPAFKAVQHYVMRNESGLGGVCVWETRDEAQLSMIRTLWNSLPVTPRVSSVCKLVPRFLRVYFDVLLTNAPPQCIERVVPLLLQRFASLYPVDFFLIAGHSLIIDTLQAIFQQWPKFLMSLKNEVVHAISKHLDVQGRLLVLHLCWIIGELLSPAMCAESEDKDGIAVFFEALEILAYEAISDRAEDSADSKRRLQGEADVQAPGGAQGMGAELSKGGASEGGDRAHALWSGHGAEEQASVEHEEAAGATGARPDAGEDDGAETPSKAQHTGEEVVFTPRFIAVICASLTKLGTKFPEFSPRVVLCLLKMQQHYETDSTEGIEFVRDRLTDSLQLLHHSAVANSVYNSQVLPGAEPDRFFSFHLSALSSLGHISHNSSLFTPGAPLHDFELPPQPPMALLAGPAAEERTAPEPSWRAAFEGTLAADASDAAALPEPARGEPRTAGEGPGADSGVRDRDCFAELRRAAAAGGGRRLADAGRLAGACEAMPAEEGAPGPVADDPAGEAAASSRARRRELRGLDMTATTDAFARSLTAFPTRPSMFDQQVPSPLSARDEAATAAQDPQGAAAAGQRAAERGQRLGAAAEGSSSGASPERGEGAGRAPAGPPPPPAPAARGPRGAAAFADDLARPATPELPGGPGAAGAGSPERPPPFPPHLAAAALPGGAGRPSRQPAASDEGGSPTASRGLRPGHPDAAAAGEAAAVWGATGSTPPSQEGSTPPGSSTAPSLAQSHASQAAGGGARRSLGAGGALGGAPGGAGAWPGGSSTSPQGPRQPKQAPRASSAGAASRPASTSSAPRRA